MEEERAEAMDEEISGRSSVEKEGGEKKRKREEEEARIDTELLKEWKDFWHADVCPSKPLSS